MALSDRENTLRTVRMTDPDRMPYGIHCTPSAWDALGEELEAVILKHPRTWPAFEKGSVDWTRQQYAPWQRPGEDYVDVWGNVWRTSTPGDTGAVVQHALGDIGKLEDYDWPDPEHYNGWHTHEMDWHAVAERLTRAKAEGRIAAGGLDHGFHLLNVEYLRGFEALMCDLLEDTPEIRRIVSEVHALNKSAVRHWIDAGAELIHLPEDLGSQDRSILGPDLMATWVTPYHRELHAMCHEAGCLTRFHCDGHVMDIADQILEIAPDIFNLQDIANGIDRIAETFKGRVCIDLDVDRQGVMPFGSPADVRELIECEVKTLGSPRGGLMIKAEVRGEVPPENVDAAASALERLCTYWFE